MIQRLFIILFVSIVAFQCKAQYTLWNSSAEREYETIEEWLWLVKDGYEKHFYHYTLDCLNCLDYCNKNRSNSSFSEEIDQVIKTYSDSIRTHLLSTFTSFPDNKETSIYFARDNEGSFLIFPGDIKINQSDIQLMIDNNEVAIDFLKNLQQKKIVFDSEDKFNKTKYLNIKIPYQKGGQGFSQWSNKDFISYTYNYNIPTNSHTIFLIYLGYFTLEQLMRLNTILQSAVDSRL